jgi:hypothetical protein
VPVKPTVSTRFVFRTSHFSRLAEYVHAFVPLFNNIISTATEKYFGQSEGGGEKKVKKITLGNSSKFIHLIRFN